MTLTANDLATLPKQQLTQYAADNWYYRMIEEHGQEAADHMLYCQEMTNLSCAECERMGLEMVEMCSQYGFDRDSALDALIERDQGREERSYMWELRTA